MLEDQRETNYSWKESAELLHWVNKEQMAYIFWFYRILKKKWEIVQHASLKGETVQMDDSSLADDRNHINTTAQSELDLISVSCGYS